MYIKLTRLDNTPIWINAAFVVTVEPRKGGGTVVVPIGDGLDYDVRETTDQVLALLGDAPAAAVVPVPAPQLLAPTPADVSPDTEPLRDEPPVETLAEEPTPAKRTRRAKKTTAETTEDGSETKPKRARRAKKSAADEPSEAKPAEEVPAVKPSVDFPDSLIERLKKMMPGSKRKLWNTLVTQFKVADAEAVVDFLRERGVIEVGPQDHIVWK